MEILLGIGARGNTPAEKYDFVTTAMHEFTHGIGFTSSFGFDKNIYIGYWGMGNNNDPIKYDDLIKTGYGSFLIYDFNNNTISLGDALTSNNLFFCRLQRRANGTKWVSKNICTGFLDGRK